jgi:hypothetical protein
MGRLRYQKQTEAPQKKKKRQRWGRREGGVEEEEAKMGDEGRRSTRT